MNSVVETAWQRMEGEPDALRFRVSTGYEFMIRHDAHGNYTVYADDGELRLNPAAECAMTGLHRVELNRLADTVWQRFIENQTEAKR